MSETVSVPQVTVRVVRGEHDEYHQAPGASSGGLWRMRRSPAHYLAGKDKEPTDAMLVGSALHDLALSPDRFESQYALWDKPGSRAKNPLKQEWDAFKLQHQGKDILDVEDTASVNGMYKALLFHKSAGQLLRESKEKELSIYWQWPTVAIPCKAKPDGIHPNGILWDLKTLEDARPHAVALAIWDSGYHLQLAWYRMAVNLAIEHGVLTGVKPITACCIVAVEKQKPHGAVVYQIDEAALAMGQAEAMVQLTNMETCVINGRFPAYSEEIELLDLPKWAK
jgi:hypothetical protein